MDYVCCRNDRGWRSSRQEETKQPPPLPTNIFSNDGSFLEQFRKLAGIKGELLYCQIQ